MCAFIVLSGAMYVSELSGSERRASAWQLFWALWAATAVVAVLWIVKNWVKPSVLKSVKDWHVWLLMTPLILGGVFILTQGAMPMVVGLGAAGGFLTGLLVMLFLATCTRKGQAILERRTR